MAHSSLTVSDFQYLRAFRKLIPTRLLERAVEATSRVRRRNRKLPAHLVLAGLVAWLFDAAARLPAVINWLCRRPDQLPSDSAVYQARASLGWAPVRWLRRRVAGPLADPDRDPSAFYRGRRLLAVDGTTLTAADSPANDKTFGRARNQKGKSGYPLIRLVAVCEVGTHALIDWTARSYRVSEQALAARLWGRARLAGSLVLADRNFHGFDLWRAARRVGYDLLLRVQSGPKLTADAVLPDGSHLSRVYPRRGKDKAGRAIRVRVITYRWTDQDGKTHTSRLVTSLSDAAAHPAAELVELYHKRWEQEGVFKEVKAALAGRATHVRARDPMLAMQEVDGLLLGHLATRWAILEAAREKGVTPVEVSFTGTLRVLRARLGGATRVPAVGRARWWAELKRALARQKLQKRRRRCCPRKKKVTRPAWPVKRKQDVERPVPALVVVPHPSP